MRFFYNSTKYPRMKELDRELVSDIRKYLDAQGFNKRSTKGELHRILVDYRTPEGKQLMINQLEPIFTFVAMSGCLWDEQSNRCWMGNVSPSVDGFINEFQSVTLEQESN